MKTAVLIAFFALAAAGTAFGQTFEIPESILRAMETARDDNMIAGVGAARSGTVASSRRLAHSYAKVDLMGQLHLVVFSDSQETIIDDVLQFIDVTQTVLSRGTLVGARPVAEYLTAGGEFWVVMAVCRTAAVANLLNSIIAVPQEMDIPDFTGWSTEELEELLMRLFDELDEAEGQP